MTAVVSKAARWSFGRNRPPGAAGRREKRRGWALSARALGFVVLAGLAAVRVWDPFPIETMRLKMFDYFQRLAPRVATNSPAVIVDIDEDSLAAYGQWPWPRTLIAELVDRLTESGAVVVGFDIIFAEPDRMSPASVARSLGVLPPEIAERLMALPSNDEVLARAMGKARVVLGRAAGATASEREGAAKLRRASVVTVGGDPLPYLRSYTAVVPNVPELEAAAKGWGMLALAPEIDGIVRRVPAIYRVGKDVHPSLVIDMLRVATGGRSYAIKSNAAGIDSVVVARAKIPTDGEGRIWVHFAASDKRRYLSAKKVLDGTAARDRLFRKVVFVGTSAAGLFDVKPTPVSGPIPGVEIHVQLLETILSGSHLSRPNYALGAEMSALVVTGLLIIVAAPMVGAWWTLLIGAAVGGGLGGGAWHLYASERILLDATFPIASAFLLYTLITFLGFAKEETGRRQIKSAFSRYLSPEVVTRLAENPSQLALGGQSRDMTLLFADVHGFTGLSESYDAESLTQLINKVLTPLTEAVLATGGTIDKYMGDAVMAFWNAPLDDPDHARNACLAALGIGAALGPLNQRLRDDSEAAGRHFRPIGVGVGVHSGECCVGNMGSDMRFDYSVLGDTVNTASRLEGQTRFYKVANVIGDTAVAEAPGLAYLELDLIRVVGKTISLRIYTVLGDSSVADDEAFKSLSARHREMLAAYRRRQWPEAASAVEACRELGGGFGLDGLYDLYAERLADFVETPPPEDWDGVYEATSKH